MGYRVCCALRGARRHRARDRGGHRHDRARHVPQPAPRPARADGGERPGARPDARLLLCSHVARHRAPTPAPSRHRRGRRCSSSSASTTSSRRDLTLVAARDAGVRDRDGPRLRPARTPARTSSLRMIDARPHARARRSSPRPRGGATRSASPTTSARSSPASSPTCSSSTATRSRSPELLRDRERIWLVLRLGSGLQAAQDVVVRKRADDAAVAAGRCRPPPRAR